MSVSDLLHRLLIAGAALLLVLLGVTAASARHGERTAPSAAYALLRR